MSPTDGCPLAALASELLAANGSPADSCSMIAYRSAGLILLTSTPCAASTDRACWIQSPIWPGGAAPGEPLSTCVEMPARRITDRDAGTMADIRPARFAGTAADIGDSARRVIGRLSAPAGVAAAPG